VVTVNDVMQHIAQDLQTFQGGNVPSEFQIASNVVSVKVALTTDLEETESLFLERLGPGRTFYFKVLSYEHGKTLASDIYKLFKGQVPDVSGHTGELFAGDEPLYLFLHLQFIELPVSEN
jgi:hypothetical protein